MITPELITRALARPRMPRASDARLSEGARDAAVVLPVVFPSELSGDPEVVAVLRAAHLSEHAGEVGFPGGKPDPGDADLYATAVRELEEEVGLAAADVERMGELTPCPVISGRYLIHAYVARVRPGAAARVASPGEIERLLSLPVMPFIRGDRPIIGVEAVWRDDAFIAPHFELDGAVLYGASAYIFFDLLVRIAAEIGVTIPPIRIVTERPWGKRYATTS